MKKRVNLLTMIAFSLLSINTVLLNKFNDVKTLCAQGNDSIDITSIWNENAITKEDNYYTLAADTGYSNVRYIGNTFEATVKLTNGTGKINLCLSGTHGAFDLDYYAFAYSYSEAEGALAVLYNDGFRPNPPLPKVECFNTDWFKLKLVMNDGMIYGFMNDKLVISEPLRAPLRNDGYYLRFAAENGASMALKELGVSTTNYTSYKNASMSTDKVAISMENDEVVYTCKTIADNSVIITDYSNYNCFEYDFRFDDFTNWVGIRVASNDDNFNNDILFYTNGDVSISSNLWDNNATIKTVKMTAPTKGTWNHAKIEYSATMLKMTVNDEVVWENTLSNTTLMMPKFTFAQYNDVQSVKGFKLSNTQETSTKEPVPYDGWSFDKTFIGSVSENDETIYQKASIGDGIDTISSSYASYEIDGLNANKFAFDVRYDTADADNFFFGISVSENEAFRNDMLIRKGGAINVYKNAFTGEEAGNGTSIPSIEIGKWNHVEVVFAFNYLKLSINDTLVYSITDTNNASLLTPTLVFQNWGVYYSLKNISLSHEHIYKDEFTCHDRSCISCNGATIKATTSHKEEVIKGTLPTCEKAGLTDGIECSDCKEIIQAQEEIKATGHHYADEYTCHDRKCENCDYVLKATTSHKEEVIKGALPTCEKAGLTDGIKCSTCNAIIKNQEEIKATGHHYADEYTCHDRKCENCDYVLKATTSHNYDDGAITTLPTYEKEGTLTYTCKDCKETKTETIPPLEEETSSSSENEDNKTSSSTESEDNKTSQNDNDKENKKGCKGSTSFGLMALFMLLVIGLKSKKSRI